MPADIFVGHWFKDRFADIGYQSKSPGAQERTLPALYVFFLIRKEEFAKKKRKKLVTEDKGIIEA